MSTHQRVEQQTVEQNALPRPSPETLAKYGLIEEDVVFSKEMTHAQVQKCNRLLITDVPGADVFARGDDNALLSPSEQLLKFQGLEDKDVNLKQLDEYLQSRGM